MHDQCAIGTDKACVVRETFKISLFRAVDVQMVGVCSRNDRSIGLQMVERTIKLVCLYNDEITIIVEQVICRIVFCDTSQKSVAAYVAFVKQMRRHSRCRRLAVRTGHAETFHLAR